MVGQIDEILCIVIQLCVEISGSLSPALLETMGKFAEYVYPFAVKFFGKWEDSSAFSGSKKYDASRRLQKGIKTGTVSTNLSTIGDFTEMRLATERKHIELLPLISDNSSSDQGSSMISSFRRGQSSDHGYRGDRENVSCEGSDVRFRHLRQMIVKHLSPETSCLLVLDNFETPWEPIAMRSKVEEFLSVLTALPPGHVALMGSTKRQGDKPRDFGSHITLQPPDGIIPRCSPASQPSFASSRRHIVDEDLLHSACQIPELPQSKSTPLRTPRLHRFSATESLAARELIRKIHPPSYTLVHPLRLHWDEFVRLWRTYQMPSGNFVPCLASNEEALGGRLNPRRKNRIIADLTPD
ncbi:hypothetical protein DFH09DRAFT_1087314 [Mycena vulgaris]|nr:hypothetical protein DFH09DRAFT_1087314 [Mycena vulgaris]